MKKIAAVITAMVITVFLCTSAFAEQLTSRIEYNYTQNKFTISGENKTIGDFVTLEILSEGKNFDDYDYMDLLYLNQQTTSESEYKFEVKYKESSGIYNARLVSSQTGEKTDFKIMILSTTDMQKLYDDLNNAATADNSAEFNEIVNKNIAYLSSNAEAKPVSDKKLNNYFEYIKLNKLDIAKSAENVRIFNTFLIIEQLNSKELLNITSEIEKMYFKDENVKAEYQKITDEEITQKYFTEKISDRAIKSIDEFDLRFKEALILTATRYGNGYGELKTIVEKYGNAIGITAKASDDVYKKFIGNDYKDGTTFKKEYDKAISDSDNSSGKGGGKSNGGSVLNSSLSGIECETDVGTLTGETEKMHMPFDDIEGVDWASEAILALADKGIINGKAPNQFNPYDAITREEFVKILIGAMGYKPNDYLKNVFADADESDWFCKYINIAYDKGLVKGVGKDLFGVGENITREDMCVMLYNALKLKISNISDEVKVPFKDSDEISDYAKTAVGVLSEYGAINGVSEDEFQPKGNATRAQAAKVIYLVYDKLK